MRRSVAEAFPIKASDKPEVILTCASHRQSENREFRSGRVSEGREALQFSAVCERCGPVTKHDRFVGGRSAKAKAKAKARARAKAKAKARAKAGPSTPFAALRSLRMTARWENSG